MLSSVSYECSRPSIFADRCSCLSRLQERRAQDYIKLKGMTEILTNFHRKLHMHGLTEAQKNEFRSSAVAKIEEGRRLLGMDMVVRTAAGEPANETNTPLVELYKMHRKATVALASNKSAVPRAVSGTVRKLFIRLVSLCLKRPDSFAALVCPCVFVVFVDVYFAS